MRILCIRGLNLASLYGQFELPLDEGVIADAGLFSISGPTGSGKSTIVDALCLALFGRTPRLGDRGRSVMVGRAGEDAALLVDANDERNILSRGTGEGHAEVHFEGVDGARYCARWTVNRARGRASGKLQNAKMVLTRLDTGEPIASGLTDVPERVEGLVGHSFDEFKRAVVLPQFEFTAFLEAKPDERAAILERVTGTDIYTRVSVAAHQRAGEEQKKLQALDDRAGAVRLLSDEERHAQERRCSDARAEQGQAQEAARIAAAQVRWHDEARRLARERDDAADAEEAARREVDAREGTRAELTAVEAAQALRPAYGEAVRTAREAGTLAERATDAKARLRQAKVDRDGAADEQQAARTKLDDAARAIEAAGPAIRRARELDLGIADTGERVKQATEAVDRARAEAGAAAEVVRRLERAIADQKVTRDAANAWLAAHAPEEGLSSEWPRWSAALRAHAEIVADLARAETRLEETKRTSTDRQSRHGEAETATRALVAEVEELGRRLERARSAAAADDRKALRRLVEDWTARRDALNSLLEIARRARDARAERDEAASSERRHEADAARARGAIAELETKVAAAEAAHEQATQALDRITAALRLEERRGALVDGEPCPLCGAVEHPYARAAPTHALQHEQKAAVDRAKVVLQEASRAVTSARVSLARDETEAARARAEQGRQATRLASEQEAFRRSRNASNIPGLPEEGAEEIALLVELHASAEAGRADAAAAEEHAITRAQELDEARSAHERKRVALEAARGEILGLEREIELARKDVEKHEESVRGLSTRREGHEADLDPVLLPWPEWRVTARADPARFARTCEAAVRAFAAREDERDRANATIGDGEREREGAAASLRERRDAVEQRGAEAEALGERLRLLREERARLIGGRAADLEERRLRSDEESARARCDVAQDRVHEAERIVSAREQEAAGLEGAVQTTAAAAREAARALDAALAVGGLDRAGLEVLLSRGPAWIGATRAELEQVGRTLHASTALLEERRRKCAEHDGTDRPAISREDAARAAADAEQHQRRAAEELVEVQVRLRDDDRNRQEVVTIATERATQDAIAVRWRRLAEVIGSADGKKFRGFAQGLALDALLLQASHHLRLLAPRYAIERVPGTDLDLQVVDHDLGDEVRTINGLSGGETFLVSLALALGLASLSTRVTQARTLFIDEGFGTLDRDTLENAMAALDTLRASGRTIGVISHVPELHERIGVRVQVERVSAGRSRVVLPDGATLASSDAA